MKMTMESILKGLRAKDEESKAIKIPQSILKKLKKPLLIGKLVSFKSFLKFLSKWRKGKEKVLIAVGDVVGKKLVDEGIEGIDWAEPDIWIYDGKEMRKRVKWKTPFPTHFVKNPKSTITPNLIAAIKDAISIGKRSKSKIFVKGEEDLSVLPAIEIASIGTIIVYGQPKKGVVFIEVNKQAKSFAKKILSSILSQPSL